MIEDRMKFKMKWTITKDHTNLNLVEYAKQCDADDFIGGRYDPGKPGYFMTFEIANNVIISSNNVITSALYIGEESINGWHPDNIIRLINNGVIIGADGEDGEALDGNVSTSGSHGGDAIVATRVVSVYNRGIISAGSGGNGLSKNDPKIKPSKPPKDVTNKNELAKAGTPGSLSAGGPPGYTVFGNNVIFWGNVGEKYGTEKH